MCRTNFVSQCQWVKYPFSNTPASSSWNFYSITMSSTLNSMVHVLRNLLERLECLNYWTFSIQYKRSITIVYVDFSNAFDSVLRSKLIDKLAACGISGCLLHWVRRFLNNRTAQTRVGTSLSALADLMHGIVQGSGIGPLLFLIFTARAYAIMRGRSWAKTVLALSHMLAR